MSLRNGRKPNEIPIKELQEIRSKERKYRQRKKLNDPKGSAKKIEENLEKSLNRPLKKQETMQIECDERRKSFMYYFYKNNGNIAAACSEVGIARSTFNNWLKNYPELKEGITEVNEAMLDLAEQQLFKNIASGKEQSLFFFLCNRGKHRGWQDVRKLAAPRLQGMKVIVHYPGEKQQMPHVEVKKIESKVIDDSTTKSGTSDS